MMCGEVKQYIIIRTDLGMSIGKIAAQASHASMKVFFDKSTDTPGENALDLESKHKHLILTKEELIWVDGIFTKIIKKVKNEFQLLKVYNQAKEAGLNVSLIEDIGLTELKGKNYTCVSIGPNYVKKCEPIVKKLRNL